MVERNQTFTLYGLFYSPLNINCGSDYAVFVDVTKFVRWITKNLKNLKFECGVREVSKSTSLSIDGVPTYHGEHPWLASLQVMQHKVFKNICGASIINKWSLVTGKACFVP